MQETGESVTLAVEVDGFPVCVDIINTTRPFKRQTAPGRILGDIATVHGKIFTAFKSPEEREAILARPLSKHTPHTVTDPAESGRRARADREGRRGLRPRGLVPRHLRRRRALCATSWAPLPRPSRSSCPPGASGPKNESSARRLSRRPRPRSRPTSDGPRAVPPARGADKRSCQRTQAGTPFNPPRKGRRLRWQKRNARRSM